MNALVPGATGFIDSCLVKELAGEKYSVRSLFCTGENVSALEKQGVTVWRGNLSVRESLYSISNGIDVVFHLTAWVADGGTKKRFYDAIYTVTKNHVREVMERIGEWGRDVYLKQ